MTEVAVDTIQRWFQTVTANKHGLTHGLHSAWHQFALSADQLIKPGHLGIERRLMIYASGYVARLLECLRADYGSLCFMLGDELFDTFARAYIMENPSTSHTLFDLGAGFAEFLDKTKPQGQDVPSQLAAQLMLPIEIARLERARVEIIRAKGDESTAAYNDSGLGILADYRVCLAKTTRLNQYAFEMIDIMQALDRRQSKPQAEPKLCNLAMWRLDFRVQMLQLEDWQYQFLNQCKTPTSLLQAAQNVAAKSDETSSQLLAKLLVWVPLLIQRQLLCVNNGLSLIAPND